MDTPPTPGYLDEDGLDIEVFATNPRDDQLKSLQTKAAILDLDEIYLQNKDGGTLNDTIHKGMGLVHFATFLGREDILESLIENGAEVNRGDEVGYTPLHIACIFGQTTCLSILIGGGALVNNQSASRASDVTLAEEPIRLAIKHQHVTCVKILLENGARPNNQYFRGYELNIVDLDQVEIIELLLKHGAEPDPIDRLGRTPLMRACKENKLKAAELFLINGADPNARVDFGDRKSVLFWALKYEELTLLLLQHSADWTQPFNHHGRYNNPVVIIVFKGYVTCLRELLDRDEFRINDLYQYRTPLGWLCMQDTWTPGHFEMLKLLLNNGADANFGCDSLESPLMCHLLVMKEKSSVSVVRWLVNFGARVLMVRPERPLYNILSLDFHKWITVPQPLIKLLFNAASTVSETAVYEKLLPNTKDPETRDMILGFITKPRGLKHLCRRVIRERLLMRHYLYEDLVSLGPFPPNLVEYVMLLF